VSPSPLGEGLGRGPYGKSIALLCFFRTGRLYGPHRRVVWTEQTYKRIVHPQFCTPVFTYLLYLQIDANGLSLSRDLTLATSTYFWFDFFCYSFCRFM